MGPLKFQMFPSVLKHFSMLPVADLSGNIVFLKTSPYLKQAFISYKYFDQDFLTVWELEEKLKATTGTLGQLANGL